MPISFREIGEGAPLLLLNGYAASAADWDPSFLDELVADARAALSHQTLDAQSAAIDGWHAAPAEDRLTRITAPTLVAGGTQDVVIPVGNSSLLADSLSGSRLEGFDGCGHAFMAQEPARLGALINEWVGR